MVDIFALALSHGLLALAAWRLLQRPQLDAEGPAEPKRPQAPIMRTGPGFGGKANQGGGDA